MGFLADLGSFIMTPLYYAISAILIGWHKVFSLVLPEDGGMNWVLSIVGLTIVIRTALIPLFVKQIKSTRNMQLLQPKMQDIRKKYGHDRERMTQETMKLYKDTGTNPFASCLPILLQMPIFFALFRMLDNASRGEAKGFMTETLANNFGEADIFGIIPIAGSFIDAEGNIGVQVVAAILVLLMTATTFLTQRQLMSKNMPPDAMKGPYAQQQKMLLYVLPLVFGLGGAFFPIGVVIYWTVSNFWTMGQQFYVIRNNPSPGTPAFKAKEERDRAKALKRGETLPEAETVVQTEEAPPTHQRVQPKRQTRSQRKGKKK